VATVYEADRSAEAYYELQTCPFEQLLERWEYWESRMGRAWLGRADRYYLLVVLLHRPDAWHPWVYARCREVEAAPDDHLDLWGREHYKSTIITFAGSIQEVIRDPEITIGIFSHTKPTAKKFFSQIKTELETNTELIDTYPEVFWLDPKNQAPQWSDEKGLVVRRRGNPRESTWEAHGLVDGQPTGSHFRLRIYDDVVTNESVSTPEQVAKTTAMHSVSDNLGARDQATGKKRAWHLGTRYKFGDSYQELLDRKALKARIYPSTDNGLLTGKPVLFTDEQWADVKRKQATATIAAQHLMNPAAGLEAMFQVAWLKFDDIRPATLNIYITCDPASSFKKSSDDTVILVIGIDATRNKWLLDGYAHKMGLAERWQRIRDLHKHWTSTPGVQITKVGYERYGLRDAIDYIEERQEIEKVSFEVIELAWPTVGGNSKYDRIQRLEPAHRAGQWHYAMDPVDAAGNPIVETRNQRAMRESGQAYRIFRPTRRVDHEGNLYSLNKKFLDQYVAYPYVTHDDVLDALSRVEDMDPAPPIIIDQKLLEPEVFADGA
jgi:hypothetical protein